MVVCCEGGCPVPDSIDEGGGVLQSVNTSVCNLGGGLQVLRKGSCKTEKWSILLPVYDGAMKPTVLPARSDRVQRVATDTVLVGGDDAQRSNRRVGTASGPSTVVRLASLEQV